MGAKKISLQIFEGKMCKNVCFYAEKLALVELAKRRIMNCYCLRNINQNKQNSLPKSLAPMDNFVKHFSAGFVFNLPQSENKQTTWNKIANANVVGLLLAYLCFCSILMILLLRISIELLLLSSNTLKF